MVYKNNEHNNIVKKEQFIQPEIEIIEFEIVSTDIYTSGLGGFSGVFDEF